MPFKLSAAQLEILELTELANIARDVVDNKRMITFPMDSLISSGLDAMVVDIADLVANDVQFLTKLLKKYFTTTEFNIDDIITRALKANAIIAKSSTPVSVDAPLISDKVTKFLDIVTK